MLVIVILQSFLTPGEPIFQIGFLGYNLAATGQGIWKGLLLGSKVIGAVSIVLLLSFVTPAYKIFHSLRWFRIPETWVEMALLVYRYTFALTRSCRRYSCGSKGSPWIFDLSPFIGFNGRPGRSGYGSFPGSGAQDLRSHGFTWLPGRAVLSSPLPDMSRKNWQLVMVYSAAIVIFYFAQEWWWK